MDHFFAFVKTYRLNTLPNLIYDITMEFFLEQPLGHVIFEVVLVTLIVYLLLQGRFQPSARSHSAHSRAKAVLSKTEEDAIIDAWCPEPLEDPPLTQSQLSVIDVPVVSSAPDTHTVVNGKDVINMGAPNYLGLVRDKRVEDAARNALGKYGCGSCGPRGFYGTIDVHLELEFVLSSFLGVGDAILFASNYSAIATSIPAFAKRSDLILCDEGASDAILEGCKLSRAELVLFKHNDMADLRRQLDLVIHDSGRGRRKGARPKDKDRRFIVTEALSQYHGDIAPLPELVAIRHQYAFRLMVDESNSIGVLGANGRGITEHFDIPFSEITLTMGCLGRALCGCGGFTVGSHDVVDHQRLSAPGYVFSASPPPFLTVASIAAVKALSDEPQRIEQLRRNAAKLRRGLKKVVAGRARVLGDVESPLIPITLGVGEGEGMDVEAQCLILLKVRDSALEHGLIVAPLHIPKKGAQDGVVDIKKFPTIPDPPPSITLHVSATHTDADINNAVNAIARAFDDR